MRTIVLLTALLTACPEPSTADKKAEAERSYGIELRACVQTAETRDEADRCAEKVREAWRLDGGTR